MTKYLIYIVLITLLACESKRDGSEVVFVVHTSQPLQDDESIFIAGSVKELGNWKPDSVKLERIESNQWRLKVNLLFDSPIEYKFTKGSWSTEAADSQGNPFPNSVLRIQNDTTVSFQIYSWTEAEETEVKGQITGNVAYHKQIKGEGLLERDIIVWLPPKYEKEIERRFPVLYMHDGQNIIDPRTASFKVDWQLDETADSLIRLNKIEPIIIVGIYNTEDRTAEYSPGEKGNAYMKFIIERVKPLIDSSYRTLPDRQNTAVGGSSMGGMISMMLAWEYSEVFSKAICMSPAFKVEEFDYVDDVVRYSGPKKDIMLYIDNGGVGLEEKLQPGIDEMLQALSSKGYEEGSDIFWVKDEKARHFEAAWAKRSGQALIYLFSSNSSVGS